MAKFQFWLPTKNLNRKQRRALDKKEPIFLTGVPGTGKTVVSIHRLLNSNNGILFTYGKLLRKTIEEKVNNADKKVVNIHKWLWENTGNYTDLEVNLDDNNISNTIQKLKDLNYEEILIDEGQDLLPNSYKLFESMTDNLSISADEAQMVMSKANGSKEEDILNIVQDLQQIELDQIYRSSYELYDFARQFVPYNKRANDTNLLERLERENSGADKPFIYKLATYNDSFEVMKDIIDDNITENIGILCPSILEVEDVYKNLKNDYKDISMYHSGLDDVPDELYNIIATTMKSAKGVEFDIVILPQFHNIDETRHLEEYYVGATRAKTELHIIAIQTLPNILYEFDKNTYKLIDRIKG